MLSRLCASVLAAAVVAACAGDSTAGWQGTITDSAGVVVVQNPAEPLWTPDQTWTLGEALRIGSAEDEPDYQFGLIAGIAVASDGRVIVADQQGQHLKVFAPDGTYERTIGQPGSGPGELGLGISGVVVGPSDTVLVADMGNQRVNIYLLDGTFVSSFRIELQEGLPLRWEATRDGRMVSQVRPVQFPGMPAPTDSSDVIVVRRSDGSAGDTLLTVPSGKTFQLGGQRPQVEVFAAEPAWALYGDGVLYGVNDQYRFGVYGPGGVLERVISKPFTPRDISEADQQTMMDAFERLWKEFGLRQEQVAAARQTIKFAARYPAYFQMLEGVDGSIWVQHVQSPTDLPAEMKDSYNPQLDLGSRAWDVFDAEGRFLGVVNMPVRFQPVRFLGDAIYGIQRDQLDVQYVVKLEVK
jgi:6-bladed beta-propeller